MSAPLAAAAGRSQALRPSPLNWAPRTGRSRRRKSLSRSAGECALGFSPASRLTGRSGNRYPSGKRKRKSGIRLPLPPRRALRGAGAGPPRQRGGGALRSPARGHRSCSQPPASGRPLWGSLALIPRGTEGRFCRIWGAEGPPGPWAQDSNRPTSYHPSVSPRLDGRGPPRLFAWTRGLFS